MTYQVVSRPNNTFWLMTSNGNWISSHHSSDEAIAACRIWFKCSPIIKQISDHSSVNNNLPLLLKKVIQQFKYLAKTLDVLVKNYRNA